VPIGAGNRVPGEVEADCRSHRRQAGLQGSGVEQVPFDEAKLGAEIPQPPRIAPGTDQRMDGVACPDQVPDEVGSDPARRPGDQDALPAKATRRARPGRVAATDA
jgi:hypothetical protein